MRQPRGRHMLLVLAVASTVGHAGVAHADAPTAEALFREGRKLFDEGDVNAACVKLAESQAQEASSGTLINLALCHEKQQKLATAWAEYAAAARLANAQGKPEREEVALRKAAELEPRLPRLTIRIAASTPLLEITRGPERISQGVLGTPVPLDPGRYVVTATATGHRPWSETFDIAEGESKIANIPALERETDAAPSVPPAAAPQSEAPRSNSPGEINTTTPPTGWLVGGAGVVLLGVGAAFGLTSLAAYRDADDACPSHRGCSEDTRATRDRAEVHAWVSNIALGLGVIGLGAGAYLVLTSRSDATKPRAMVRAGAGSVMLERSF